MYKFPNVTSPIVSCRSNPTLIQPLVPRASELKCHLPSRVILKIAKTGALCCVASGPHGAKSSANSRDYSYDPNEPHWRTNSSFSPPLPRTWDCRFQSDGLSHGAPLYGSSLSSHSKGSRSRVSSDQYPNHHHSVSDGALSYYESPSESFQAPRWTPSVQKFNFEVASPSLGGSRPESSLFPHPIETRFTAGASAVANSFGSPSPLSESWESSSKHPLSLTHRNASSRRSFMSKPVYPLVFQNPVSNSGACGSGDINSMWSEGTSIIDLKFHNTLTELQKMEASPDPSTSSRREGFRWSNASSYEMGFDGESIDITEQKDLENVRFPYNPTDNQKCGLCGRLLLQKSPWSSYRIVKTIDMPTAGVLPCRHIFHAECLEQTTPKTQIHDPPCPMCQKTANAADAFSPVSKPLQMALRAVRRNQGVNIVDDSEGNSGNQLLDQTENRMKRNRSLSIPSQGGSSSIKNRFKKHFSFKGKTGKDLFGVKMFHRAGSSSSDHHDNLNPVGCLGTGQSSQE